MWTGLTPEWSSDLHTHTTALFAPSQHAMVKQQSVWRVCTDAETFHVRGEGACVCFVPPSEEGRELCASSSLRNCQHITNPKQQPQEQSQTVGLYSGASSSEQGWGPQLSSLTGGSRVSTKPGAIHILPSALCLHSGLRLLWAS